MPLNQAANNFSTTLAAAALSTDTTLDLTTLTGAPAYPYLLTLTTAGATGPPFSKVEIVLVTGLSSGTTVTVVRAQEGTTAQAWSTNDTAANDLTAGSYGDLLGVTSPPDWARFDTGLVMGNADGGALTIRGSGQASWGDYSADFWSGTTSGSSVVAQMFALGNPGSLGVWWGAKNGVAIVGTLMFAPNGLPAASGDVFQVGMGNGSAYPLGNQPALVLRVYYDTALRTALVWSYGSQAQETVVASSVAIADTTVQHSICIWTNGSVVKMWIDGTLAATAAISETAVSAWIAGVYVANGSASTTNVNGMLRGLRMVHGMY